MSSPRIYVACLAAYNNGKLHGRWIDAAQDADDIQAEVQAMLSESPEPDAEEWAIHDYEMGGIDISESESFAKISELALAIEEHGEPFIQWYNNLHVDIDDLSGFADCYLGEFESVEDYAYESLKDSGAFADVPEMFETYFDFEAYARDLVLNGEIWTSEESGKVYVFQNS